MQQLSGSGGRANPLSPLASPRILALGPARGVENKTRLSGPLSLPWMMEAGADWTADAVEGGGVAVEDVGLVDLGARAGLMVFFAGSGMGEERRRE